MSHQLRFEKINLPISLFLKLLFNLKMSSLRKYLSEQNKVFNLVRFEDNSHLD